ncbi:hypothetical protein DLAC_02937 [Tieghemostelium lacteum]|uniref:Transmembrane protein n=1 Tax=Tieghemostelium lacteum TaxID=361077 RepID=A0A152A484_TIELA|nr:hypothetical protein DLAC_02937 [Tieghemostelium lacteum]|eukprot:KYR00877.1 hypothetical protein DLAC_02937 [Tieghemostelium lacteum]
MTIETKLNQIVDNKIENDLDSDSESVDLTENKRQKFPYKRIGKSFLVVAILVAVFTIVLPTALYDRIGLVDDGLIFRALFGVFMFCLFICLINIYYLGGESQAWDADTDVNDLDFSFSNVIAIIGIIIEFVQICSFSFNATTPFLGSEALRHTNYIAIPYSEGISFKVMYWVMFAFAFTPYIFIVMVRLIVHIMTRRNGEDFTSQFMTNHQQNIYSVLWFLVNTMYLPVIGTMFGGIDCTFTDSEATLDSDPVTHCLKGLHVPYIICSLLALVMYYPAASFAQSQTQSISDIKFKPRIVFIFAQGKVILAAITVFATTLSAVYLSAVIVVNFIFLIINVLLKPCLVEWVNRMRTVFFSFCLLTTICSCIAYGGVDQYIPLVLLIVGYVALAVCFAIYYQIRESVILFFKSKLFKNQKSTLSSSQVANP